MFTWAVFKTFRHYIPLCWLVKTKYHRLRRLQRKYHRPVVWGFVKTSDEYQTSRDWFLSSRRVSKRRTLNIFKIWLQVKTLVLYQHNSWDLWGSPLKKWWKITSFQPCAIKVPPPQKTKNLIEHPLKKPFKHICLTEIRYFPWPKSIRTQ